LRYAIISDIHGNLQALQEVLALVEHLKVSWIICLGDIVGYGGDPSACIDLVRRKCSGVILGNHDAAAVGLTSISFFNPVAAAAALWTRKVLTEEEKSYLSQLPLRQQFDDFEIVHSTPDQPQIWRYLMIEEDAEPLFNYFRKPILFYGHTHLPMVFEKGEEGVRLYEASDFKLQAQSSYIVNVGSVGQPRDGDPRASFAVYDSTEKEVSFYRVPYDIHTAQRRILDNGLPSLLAARLEYGS